MSRIGDLKLNEDVINIIQSITMEEIHLSTFALIRSSFINSLSTLLSYSGEKMRTLILVLHDIQSPSALRYNYTFDGFISWMVFNWLNKFLEAYGVHQFNYNMMTFGNNQQFGLLFPWNDMLEGNNLLVKDQIQLSNTRRPPSIIPSLKTTSTGSSTITSSTRTKIDKIIYICKG